MVARRRRTFCGSLKRCRRSLETSTGRMTCLLNTSVSGCRICPTRWSKPRLNGSLAQTLYLFYQLCAQVVDMLSVKHLVVSFFFCYLQGVPKKVEPIRFTHSRIRSSWTFYGIFCQFTCIFDIPFKCPWKRQFYVLDNHSGHIMGQPTRPTQSFIHLGSVNCRDYGWKPLNGRPGLRMALWSQVKVRGQGLGPRPML